MESLIILVHVLTAIAITGLVLIQHGKGADVGASFGSGASQTMFGSAGSGNALTKSTTIMAVIFFITSLGLAVIARQQADLGVQNSGLIANPDQITTQQQAPEAGGGDIPVAQEAAAEGDIPVVDAQPADDVPAADAGETTDE